MDPSSITALLAFNSGSAPTGEIVVLAVILPFGAVVMVMRGRQIFRQWRRGPDRTIREVKTVTTYRQDKPDEKPKTVRTIQEVRVSPADRYGVDPADR